MSLLQGLWSFASSVFSLIKKKPKWTEAVPMVLAQVLPLVSEAIAYGNADTKEKFDDWLEGFDVATGSDPGAAHVFPDIPPDKAEEFFDHVKEAARIFGYAKLKVPGFTNVTAQ